MLTQNTFIEQAGDRAVVWIDPARVKDHAGTKWPVGKRNWRRYRRFLPKPIAMIIRSSIRGREPILIPDDCFGRELTPVSQTERYQKVADFIAHRDTPRDSEWYGDLCRELSKTGIARHKAVEMRSEAEILGFFDTYVCPMIDSLIKDGFKPEFSGYESSAVIGPDGVICKTSSGNHRFNVAKVVGLTRFPLKILGIHEAHFTRHASGQPQTTQTMLALIHETGAQHTAS